MGLAWFFLPVRLSYLTLKKKLMTLECLETKVHIIKKKHYIINEK